MTDAAFNDLMTDVDFNDLMTDLDFNNDLLNDIFADKTEMISTTTSRHSIPLSSEQLNAQVSAQIPETTKRHAKWAKKTFDGWLEERNQKILTSGSSDLMFLSSDSHSTLADLTKDSLNTALQYFFFEVKKKNFQSYPSNSLRSLYAGINYWLNHEGGKSWKLFTDPDFEMARQALDSAMKKSAKDGNNGREKRALPISTEQDERLWMRGYLGSDNPKNLIV